MGTHITSSERLEISILLGKKYSAREIAKALGRNHSSISREISRNKVEGYYLPKKAIHKAYHRRKYSKYQGMKIEDREELKQYIIRKLKLFWTPEEISGRLKMEDTYLPYISAKGIYRWLYSSYGQKYCYFLPKQRFRPKKSRGKKTERSLIPNRVGIEERPEGANSRSEYGHFENDTIVSGKKTGSKVAISVICERKSIYTRLNLIPNLKPQTHNRALKKMLNGLKISTLTYDNGIENRDHEELALALEIQTYFCHPYHSWEKGTIENTNGRIRRFIPKGTDLSKFTDKQIQKVEDWLNHTPRKCLNYQTPYEIMQKNLRFISTHPSGAIEG